MLQKNESNRKRNPETYRTTRDQLGLKNDEEIIAHIMVDEMKLTNSIWSSIITSKNVGFVSKDSNLKSICEDALVLI